jgi:hypothetical protein
MKRVMIFVVAVSSSALFAQVNGVPASVTSFTGGKPNGVPSSVTSLGPRGFSQKQQVQPAHNGHHGGGGGRGGMGGGRGGVRGGTVYVPYAYPYPVAVEPDQAMDPNQVESEVPAPTIFENRPTSRPRPEADDDSRYREHYLDSRERSVPPAAEREVEDPHHNMSGAVEEVDPVVIVFKDGHQQEIGNYAIVGDTLFDLSGKGSHKIKLADLDLKQTVEKNEQRGVEFNLPAGYKG